ncbi:MAG: NAD(P)H-dependent oxidoreductase [Solobacterium sp.]|nr:NAD(P)H-dependent oxidoreductase [Solobacterium sp.]
MSTLIAYFSRADENYFGGEMRYIEKGNTEIVAEKIAGMIDTDVFKIEMETPYAKEYMTCINEAKEHKNKGIRPALKALPESIDAYDRIILAYPNYWGTYPMAIVTFLEHFDFSGKTIYPLCTNEGSGMGNSESDLKKTLPSAQVKKGLSLTGSTVNRADNKIQSWLKGNGLL